MDTFSGGRRWAPFSDGKHVNKGAKGLKGAYVRVHSLYRATSTGKHWAELRRDQCCVAFALRRPATPVSRRLCRGSLFGISNGPTGT
jgi:hypothetical protein